MYILLLNPKSIAYSINRDNLELFVVLVYDSIQPFNVSQHRGIKVCMYRWCIIMKKKNMTHTGCSILKGLKPELFTFAEVFGKNDMNTDDRYKFLMNMLRVLHQVNYYPRSYEHKTENIPVKGSVWEQTFPKLVIVSDLMNRC